MHQFIKWLFCIVVDLLTFMKMIELNDVGVLFSCIGWKLGVGGVGGLGGLFGVVLELMDFGWLVLLSESVFAIFILA
jgi:hypothetical protein